MQLNQQTNKQEYGESAHFLRRGWGGVGGRGGGWTSQSKNFDVEGRLTATHPMSKKKCCSNNVYNYVYIYTASHRRQPVSRKAGLNSLSPKGAAYI